VKLAGCGGPYAAGAISIELRKSASTVDLPWPGATTGITIRQGETPVRYICIVHFEGRLLDEMPAAERKSFDLRSAGYDKELQEKGHYVIAEAIQGGESAVLVRVRNGRPITTDGPYIETKEQMAGFILIEARDMNEAIRLASGIPLAELGTIEVRPIYQIPDPNR
jgi:hypothetical protein